MLGLKDVYLLIDWESVQVILIYLVGVNVFSFLLMGWDKFKAKAGMSRVSHRTFYILSLLLGYPGILLGSRVFHHKTRKPLFHLICIILFAFSSLVALYLIL